MIGTGAVRKCHSGCFYSTKHAWSWDLGIATVAFTSCADVMSEENNDR